MEMNIGNGVAVMTPETRKRDIPILATKIVLGAHCTPNYCNKKDTVRVFFDHRDWPVHQSDYDIARIIADTIQKRVDGLAQENCLHHPSAVLELISLAQALYTRQTDSRTGKRGIIMLSDSDGCGYWRMRLPAKHMAGDNWFADLSAAQVNYDALLEYDTIFVQRFHEWDAYYVLERLKAAGKRIVYDIDDDMFSIPWDNPAASVIRKDQQFAAMATMRLADVVTISTEFLQHRLEQDLGLRGKTVVIPNALDLTNMTPTPFCGSPDDVKRIFWQGGSTHAADWEVCLEAIGTVMSKTKNVRLVLLGYLPPKVLEMVKANKWLDRVEHMGFSEPETYYELVKGVRADVGIAPLVNNLFNSSKCVDISMRISTREGIVEAGKIKPGMKVWRDGWKKVEAVEIGKQRKGLRIETKKGYVLRLSHEHRMMVNGKWTQAKNIVNGNTMEMSSERIGASKIVRTPWPSDSRMNKAGRSRLNGEVRYSTSDPYSFLTSPDVPKIDITPRWARLLGAYVGDGSVGQKTAMRISCDGQDQDWIDMLMDDLKAIGLNPRTESVTTFDGTVLRRREIRVSSAHLVRVLESLGLARIRENKRPIRVTCVPEVIWRSPKEVVAEFLAGYFEADGSTGSCNVSAVSKDEWFLRDIQRLLVAFGIVSQLKSRKYSCQTFTDTYWNLILTRDATDVFEREVGFRSKRKRMRLAEITARNHSNAFRPMSWEDEVISIRNCKMVPVDIQVEGREFILAGFVSHNSELKWIENSFIGMPTVASKVAPYESVIEHGKSGFLVSTPNEWHQAIMTLLTDEDLNRSMLVEARKKLEERFDIKKVAAQWAKVLLQ